MIAPTGEGAATRTSRARHAADKQGGERGLAAVIPVRRATRADIAVLAHLQREFGNHLRGMGDDSPGLLLSAAQWSDILSRPHLGCLVAEDRGGPVGYLSYHEGYDLDRGGPVVYVFDLFVRATSRRRGVGRALMAEAAGVCTTIGGREILFDVWRRNDAAIAFYARLGAIPVRELQYMHLPVAALSPPPRGPGPPAPPSPRLSARPGRDAAPPGGGRPTPSARDAPDPGIPARTPAPGTWRWPAGGGRRSPGPRPGPRPRGRRR